jgi:hypothetical protein
MGSSGQTIESWAVVDKQLALLQPFQNGVCRSFSFKTDKSSVGFHWMHVLLCRNTNRSKPICFKVTTATVAVKGTFATFYQANFVNLLFTKLTLSLPVSLFSCVLKEVILL